MTTNNEPEKKKRRKRTIKSPAKPRPDSIRSAEPPTLPVPEPEGVTAEEYSAPLAEERETEDATPDFYHDLMQASDVLDDATTPNEPSRLGEFFAAGGITLWMPPRVRSLVVKARLALAQAYLWVRPRVVSGATKLSIMAQEYGRSVAGVAATGLFWTWRWTKVAGRFTVKPFHRKYKISKKKKEIVFRYDGQRPRRALIPIAELRERVPRAARRAHDNAKIRQIWTYSGVAGGALIGAALGLLVAGLAGAFEFGPSATAIAVVLICGMIGAVLGWPLGRVVLASLMIVPPMWFIRTNGDALGEPEPIIHDAEATALGWVVYFQNLHKAISEESGEEEANQRVPVNFRSGDPTARYDAVSMAHLETQDDARRMIQGWHNPKDIGGMVKLTGMMAIGIIAVVVFSMIINDAKLKQAAEAGGSLLTWLT